MNQKTNNIYTFPQVILSEKGNSYLGAASKLVGHAMAQSAFKELLKLKNERNTNAYFVYERQGDNFILRAAQSTIEQAKFYYNNGDNTNRVIVHFDKYFIP